jgi:ribonucleoside-diphosphate reductase alpha chain
VLAQYQILRRNGAVVAFEPSKIAVAMMKAFLAVHGTQGAASSGVRDTVEELTAAVVRALMRSRPGGGTFHIEDVQDQVELGLMRSSNHEVARSYVLYRERRAQERAAQGLTETNLSASGLFVVDGSERRPLNEARLLALISSACAGLGIDVRPEPIAAETMRNIYDGIPLAEVHKASILAARTLIEKDPGYTYATARLLLHTIRREIIGRDISQDEMVQEYPAYFGAYIQKGISAGLLD